MNKRWFLMLVGIMLSAIIVSGCNADPDPAPPVENQVDEELDQTNELDEENGENLPGVDEDDTMTQDDENDNDPDPEDPIEDAEDIGDENNIDE